MSNTGHHAASAADFTADVGRRLFSCPEACRQLGISRYTLAREIAAGEFDVVWIRSRKYLTAESIERYIERHREVASAQSTEMREPDLGRAQSSRDESIDGHGTSTE